MIKLSFAVRRRADVEPDEFHRYWRDEHGPLVRSFQETLGIRRYVQLHRVETPFNDALQASRNALEPFDGVAELWWDDLDSARGRRIIGGRCRSESGPARGRRTFHRSRPIVALVGRRGRDHPDGMTGPSAAPIRARSIRRRSHTSRSRKLLAGSAVSIASSSSSTGNRSASATCARWRHASRCSRRSRDRGLGSAWR